jgi:DNA-binding NarL/FixJ family response regulator
MNVVVVEDDARYRASLETLFAMASGFTLAGSWATPLEALPALERAVGDGSAWDLALMDVDLPGMSGIEATRRIKRLSPRTLVVVLTVFEEPATILEAICAGADGYLLKKTAPQELLAQLEVVAAGGAPLTAGVARTVLALVRGPQDDAAPASPDGLRLTARERDVLRGLVKGLAYKQVADTLGISIDTVRTHVRGMYRKLQVHSVAEAVGRAIRERLVD